MAGIQRRMAYKSQKACRVQKQTNTRRAYRTISEKAEIPCGMSTSRTQLVITCTESMTGPTDSMATDTGNQPTTNESPEMATKRQQGVITKLTWQGRVIWQRPADVGDSAEEHADMSNSETSTDEGEARLMASLKISPPNLPFTEPATSPSERKTIINCRYHLPGSEIVVWHHDGKVTICGSGQTPWVKQRISSEVHDVGKSTG